MLMSIILGLAVALAAAYAKQLIIESESGRETFVKSLSNSWFTLLAPAIVVGIINYSAPRLAARGTIWPSQLFLVIMVCFYVHLMYWWYKEGGTIKEMIPFIILALLFYFPTKVVATLSAINWNGKIITPLIDALPLGLLVASVGYFIINYFYFRYREVERSNSSHLSGILAIVVTSLLLATIFGTGLARATKADNYDSYDNYVGDEQVVIEDEEVYSPDTPTTDATEEDVEDWYYFYNQELQSDSDEDNDFNFGPSPYIENQPVSYYDAELRNRMKWDPALAAADTAWLDANVGTRYLGKFYESCKGDWAETINLAKERFMKDQDAYYKNLDAFFAFLDSAKKVEVKKVESGLEDQMYMNPYTVDGTPDVIVMKTDNHSGWFLVYTFNIKGKAFEVAYRINCGYQPTNVEKVMGIKPQSKPKKSTPPAKTTPPKKKTPPTPTPPTPDPPKPTPPTYNKDKTKGTKGDVVKPNDDKGPGTSTNNGKGATKSTKDQPTNSTSYSSYEQYKKDMQDMKNTNQNQNTGGGSNKPSTSSGSGTNVDNNAQNGTGHGGIDTPTPTTKPATEAGSGQAIDSNPGGAWGGPSD